MDLNQTLENLRGSYQDAAFDLNDCHKDPVIQFDLWLEDAIKTQCDEPNAFVLSTVKNDQPRARVVLLKGIRDDEFIFYTNYQSAKGDEIRNNDKVSMTFLWLPLQRQIRIEGTVSLTSEELSEDYFRKRPRGSQLGAIASPQSQKVSSRDSLEQMFQDADKKFQGIEVLPRPKHWGGYKIKPTYFEFWQGRKNRMHDRISYERVNGSWEVSRLAP